jgi:hypothetical protein
MKIFLKAPKAQSQFCTLMVTWRWPFLDSEQVLERLLAR